MGASETEMDHPRREPTEKICERCGVDFSCGALKGPCWCEAVKLGAERLADLRIQYRDCLCPRCLSGGKAVFAS